VTLIPSLSLSLLSGITKHTTAQQQKNKKRSAAQAREGGLSPQSQHPYKIWNGQYIVMSSKIVNKYVHNHTVGILVLALINNFGIFNFPDAISENTQNTNNQIY